MSFKILKDNFNDIGEGFEIQSPDKKFIAWDTSLESICNPVLVCQAQCDNLLMINEKITIFLIRDDVIKTKIQHSNK